MDMATVTKYLERSVQNCSLSNQIRSFEDELGLTDESGEDHVPILDRTLELNSHISIPSHLEQCLDLKVESNFICFLVVELFCLMLHLLHQPLSLLSLNAPKFFFFIFITKRETLTDIYPLCCFFVK